MDSDSDDYTVQETVANILSHDSVYVDPEVGQYETAVATILSVAENMIHHAAVREEGRLNQKQRRESGEFVTSTVRRKPPGGGAAAAGGAAPAVCVPAVAPACALPSGGPPSADSDNGSRASQGLTRGEQGLGVTLTHSPTTSDVDLADGDTGTLRSLDMSRNSARKQVKDGDASVRAARKAHGGLCVSAAIAYLEKDVVIKDVKQAVVLAECEKLGRAGKPALLIYQSPACFTDLSIAGMFY